MGHHKEFISSPRNYEVRTLEEVSRIGMRTFYTGMPCVHGHVVPRYASTGDCMGCLEKWGRSWEQSND